MTGWVIDLRLLFQKDPTPQRSWAEIEWYCNQWDIQQNGWTVVIIDQPAFFLKALTTVLMAVGRVVIVVLYLTTTFLRFMPLRGRTDKWLMTTTKFNWDMCTTPIPISTVMSVESVGYHVAASVSLKTTCSDSRSSNNNSKHPGTKQLQSMNIYYSNKLD